MEKNFLNELKRIYNSDILLEKEGLYPYAYDTSPNPDEIILPLAVVFPTKKEQVSETMKLCSKYKIPAIARGAGTCHCGGCRLNQKSIVIHFSKMDKILEINKEDLTMKVEPNATIKNIQDEAKKFNLFFPPDPSNLAVSTIGGAIALNSGGPRTFKYGSTKNYVINLKVVLSNGEIVETSSKIAKDVTGYDLTSLFIGSEGTLGIIVEATLRLIPLAETKRVTFAYFDSLKAATSAVNAVINSGFLPATLDLLDQNTLVTIEKYKPCGLLCDKKAALLIELEGFFETIDIETKKISKVLKESGATDIIQAQNEDENEKIWQTRRSAFAAVTKLKPNVITEDVVVPRSKIVKLVEGIEKIAKEHNLIVCTMGHAGDGNIHPNFALNLANEEEKNNFNFAKDKLFKLAIELGGTLSGEHGIGSEKKKYLKSALDLNALKYMQKIKEIFDPDNIVNPNKMF